MLKLLVIHIYLLHIKLYSICIHRVHIHNHYTDVFYCIEGHLHFDGYNFSPINIPESKRKYLLMYLYLINPIT